MKKPATFSPELALQLEACFCGSAVPPRSWKKYGRAHGAYVRCPSCRYTSPIAATTVDDLVRNWNDPIRARRAETITRRAMSRRPDPVPVGQPTAGLYAMRLVKDGPRVAVRIWFGHAIIDGEEQDRGEDWRVEIDGATDFVERDKASGYECRVPIPVERAWPWCAREPISESEYRFLTARADWAKEHKPEHPAAQPRKAIDVRTLAPIF